MAEYPLIIVDDEPLARDALSHLLKTSFPGFTVAGEADSGPAGVELFRKFRPPIVIMDIRIPGFDGLEASRAILKDSPDTQILVLSAFDDFNYVQEALHDGVIGYLLKPVREDRLRILLEKAVSRIGELKSRQQERKEISTYRNLAVREQVASFIYGSKGGIPAEEFAGLSDPPVRQGYFLIFRVEREHPPGAEEIKKVNAFLDRMKGILPGDWMGGYLPVFVSSEAKDIDDWRSEAGFLSREIAHLLRGIAGGKIRSGAGALCSPASRFGDSFHMAFDALQEDRESGKLRPGRVSDSYPVEKEHRLLEACRASDGNAALIAAENLADDLISPDSSLMDSRFAVTEFLIVFRREWEALSGTPKRRAMANLLREVLLCNDHAVLREWFLLVVRDLIRSLSDEGGGDDLIIRKVKHFIDLNDLREVSLESAADSIGITSPYLSRLFREQTGQLFHEYVVERRLNTAASMLRESNLPVGEIAFQVGYGDAVHFGRIFRKRYGSSPRDYRNIG